MGADSLITQLMPLAEHADQCRVLWVAKCPTRTGVFVTTATVAGSAAFAAGKGWIRVPRLSLKF